MGESEAVIRVENLSKRYVISRAGERGKYTTLRDTLATGARSLSRRLLGRGAGGSDPRQEEFWALKDVSFEVKRGEVVGIIGRNGAGKSTLLKILSRITEPTSGRIEIDGRLASLLEVGTGFHPELSGRENIYLNGAILGMSRAEIKRKFDEIVAFAEVEKFLDTPVKRYSSGMYVRLAFAVAAHLEPEILIVDEVLAVGDTAFQKRCLGKMGEVARDGRTVLFVSHNMTAVRNLCRQGIVLHLGLVTHIGNIEVVVDDYTRQACQWIRETELTERTDRIGSGRAQITGLEVRDATGRPLSQVRSGQDVVFNIRCKVPAGGEISEIVASIGIGELTGNYSLLLRSNFSNHHLSVRNLTDISCRVNDFPLAEGVYSMTLFLSHRDNDILDCIPDAAELRVEGGDFFRTGSHGLPALCRVLTRSDWSCT